jgi:hypothetical protein
MADMEVKTCIQCKCEFTRPNGINNYLWSVQRYCGYECQKKGSTAGHISKTGAPAKECATCHKVFVKPPRMGMQNWRQQRFCCPACKSRGFRLGLCNKDWRSQEHSPSPEEIAKRALEVQLRVRDVAMDEADLS